MMLASQKRAARDWLIGILADLPTVIPAERVVWGNQDANAPRPYVQLLYTAGARQGPAPERVGVGAPGFEEKSSTTVGTGTISITVVGVAARDSLDQDADSFVAELASRVTDHDFGYPLDGTGLAVQTFTELLGLASLTGQSQWETRAALDVTFNVGVDYRSTPGIVETVVIDGTTEPPTPIGTFEVTTSP